MIFQLTLEELKKLGNCTFALRSFEYSKNHFYIKAWVAKIHSGTEVECIISELRPKIFDLVNSIHKTERIIEADEQEDASRKDTVWGDIKLLSKKAYREANHHIGHASRRHDLSFDKFINLKLTLSENLPVSVGEQINIRLSDIKTVSSFFTFGKDLVKVNGRLEENFEKNLASADYYLRQRNRILLSLLAMFLVALFYYNITSKDIPQQSEALATPIVQASNASVAKERYVQSFFKNYKIIASRSVTINKHMLQQSYDLNGKLRVENYSDGKTVEGICINSFGEILNTKNAQKSEKFFACLLEYNEILANAGGVIDDNLSTTKRLDDIDLNSKGKNLK